MTSIQKATPADSHLLTGIAQQTFLESHGHSAAPADIESYKTVRLGPAAIQEELNNPEFIYHILYYNNQPGGYSKIIFNQPYPAIKNKNVTKLERLYLLKEFYDQKLGASLFNHAVDLSKNAGQSGMWLYVWMENERAIRFYKKSGFSIIGHADFKVSENHSNPNHIMYLEY